MTGVQTCALPIYVETLFDIDIELKQLAVSIGMQLERMPMLNAAPALIETLVSVIDAHQSSQVS